MPGVVRLGDDVDTVHAENSTLCTAPIIIQTITASPDIFVNGIAAHRQTDLNTSHGHCPPVYSTGISVGSSNVFFNNLGVARLGDTYDCGAKTIEASADVFVN